MARIRTAVACVAAGLLGAGIVAAVMAAAPPVPAKAAERWEHAELHDWSAAVVGATLAEGAVVVNWVTADAEVGAINWEDLSARLKLPAAMKGTTENSHRLRAFDRLTADGWEFTGRRAGSGVVGASEIWSLRRRVK